MRESKWERGGYNFAQKSANPDAHPKQRALGSVKKRAGLLRTARSEGEHRVQLQR